MANPSLDKNPNLDAWLTITADGRVIVRNGKVDIGQRISTAVAMLVAEELDVAIERIDVVRAETLVTPDEGLTSGSNSIVESGSAARLAAATARRHLLGLAASALDVEISTLEVDDGLVQSRATNRSTTYWELAGGKAFGIPIDPEVEIKPPEARRIVGRPAATRGMEDIVTGRPYFIHDKTMPGMLHGRVVRPPHYHARLRGLDDSVIGRLESEGVGVVRDGSFLAVTTEDEYTAIIAAERLFAGADWQLGDGLEPEDLFKRLTEHDRISLPVIDGAPQKIAVPDLGDPPAGAAVTIAADYQRPYQMHGSLAPSAALALYEGGKLSVWTHSQGVYVLRDCLAEALDMAVEDLTLTHVPGSGCYGHNGADDVALDAALVARAMPGTPILLKWTREDEHAWEPYGSCMALKLRASLDSNGVVIDWSHESYSGTYNMRPRPGPNKFGAARLLAARFLADPLDVPVPEPAMRAQSGIHRNLEPLYNFHDRRLVKNLVRDMPLRTSALRALGAFGNVFAIESFMEELADASNQDPVEFRLRHLDDARAVEVVKSAREQMKQWGEAGDGYGHGLAFAQYKNGQAYAAVGIEVEVTDDADIRLHRAVIAADAGQVVDPGGLASQLEGGLIQAASWTLCEEVRYDRDGITSRDWDSYPILRFDNIPVIETVLIDQPNEPFMGAGEATAGPTGAAIANAVRRATGLSLRRMPFTPEALRAAALA